MTMYTTAPVTVTPGCAVSTREVVGRRELDLVYQVPRPLQLRVILVVALWVGALSLAAAMEWPRFWMGIVVVNLFATSVVFALAACRQWIINAPVPVR